MRTVAVIGAGASGITAIKCSLDEGLEPTCFERTDDIGGLWNYTESARYGQACVMKSTVINTSKEMMCYSDFPIPKDYPMFLHNTHVKRYFDTYVDNFNLKKYIRFQTEVLMVKPTSDFYKTGQWTIKVKDAKTGKEEESVFDAVLVCTGHHAYENKPDFPGLKEFQGNVIHSHIYKSTQGYEGKSVVVVGIGNSGGDAAAELSRVASQVYLSTRRGSWVFSRMGGSGLPLDMIVVQRWLDVVINVFPAKFIAWLLKSSLNKRFNHKSYALEPKHSPMSQHPTANDDLPNRISCGSIVIKPNIKRFTRTGVIFDDDTQVDNLDHVILATGYVFGFPFLDKSVLDVKDNQIKMYKYMFPPDQVRNTLAVIGCFQPIGALMPISEMQCRLATRVFKGDVTLPPKEEMWEEIQQKRDMMASRYVKSARHTIQVDFINYMDQLATVNGNRPNFLKLMLTDPVLAYKCYFGPCSPYQYRLQGSQTWSGARKAIVAQWDNTISALQTRPLGLKQDGSGAMVYILIIAVFIIAYLFRFFFL
ncbi:dimethylaniline monooxygenase [N-oxide-forming] 5-like [Mizuhopecten yessoensis]|uniref:Flavin-containing monooxygenase n=1 Tax=Mizuhopecten yessoensis TaxID=6573 RepID=A0A210R0T5_MIZYE|nr:dimethylaniline monooxygenase [N-oxide-forming] 5-like [Mizuhopecten yessoensis]OWF54636.1 Dimethylaniline monooxygenase [N-oxide-forming] 5 [Mizuhopecten yessoensis]